MTTKQAIVWMWAQFGEVEAETIIKRCAKMPDALEAVVQTQFHACDPRRQKLRQAVRVLVDEMKGNK